MINSRNDEYDINIHGPNGTHCQKVRMLGVPFKNGYQAPAACQKQLSNCQSDGQVFQSFEAAVPKLFGTRDHCFSENLMPDDLEVELWQ